MANRQIGLAADADDELADLERLWQSLELPGYGSDPPGITVFSQPGADGYGRRQTAAAGQPLRLPEPFGIALDTARLLG